MLFDPGPGQALRLALLALPLMLLPSWAAAAAPEDSGDRRPARQVVITIDDLPRAGAGDTLAAATEVTESILASLTRHHVPAVGFVVGQRTLVPGEIDARLRLLQRWQEAGAELGNHSWSHPAFNQTALPDYQDDVIRGDLVPRLLNQAGQPPRRYFRHPYNQTGNDQPRLEAFRAFMQARGMIITPFTVEHADYLFNTLWLEAVEDGDRETAQRLSRAYLDHMEHGLHLC